MEERFAAQGIKAHRVEAVIPETITDAEQAVFTRVRYDPISFVEMCCNTSHRNAMKALLASDEPHCAIFEDDVIMADDLANFFEKLDWMGMPCDVLRIETFMQPSQLSIQPIRQFAGYDLHGMQSWTWGAAGYVINRKAAETYLSSRAVNRAVIDRELWQGLGAAHALKIAQLSPALVVQEDRMQGGERKGSDMEGARATDAQNSFTPLDRLRKWCFLKLQVGLRAGILRVLKLSHRTIVPFAGSGVAVGGDKA